MVATRQSELDAPLSSLHMEASHAKECLDNGCYFEISNEGIVPNEISRTSRGPVKAACGPGPRDVRDIS